MIVQRPAKGTKPNRSNSTKSRSLALLFALWGLLSSSVHAETIELVHFWKSPAERAALEIFANSFEARGGKWYGTTRADQTTLKSYAIDRIATDNAPSAIQWHGGPEVEQMIDLNITNSLESVSEAFSADLLFPTVVVALTVDGETSALPVGIHGENWVWQNLNIFRELDLSPPRTWEEFLAQAKPIRDAGYVPIAIGDTSWERAIVFNSILLGRAGADLYRRILVHDLDPASDRLVLTKVLQTFQHVRDEAAISGEKFEGWLQANRSVIDGRAAIQVMGDWAKGEFLQAGKKLGEDFDCSISFSGGVVMIVLDVFVLPNSSDESVRGSQRMLIETVLNSKNQREFSMLKGSLPVVSGVDQTGFDRCARKGLEALADPAGTVPAYLLVMPQERGTGVETAIEKIWANKSLSPEEATDVLLDHVREKSTR